jgi:hypothetical protein
MPDRPRFAGDVMRPSAPQPEQKPLPRKTGSFWRKRWVQIVIVGVVALALGWLIYGYVTTKMELAKLNKNPGGSDVQQLVGDISKHMQLPDESPTLATVNDVGKLKNQEFFKNAQNGDKVLIFSKDGRALLYRTSTKKVIEYSKVDLNAPSK